MYLRIFGAFFGALLCSQLSAQEISGKVVDAKTGEPIPGVNIYRESTTTGTSSGVDGSFTHNFGSDFPFALVFSFVGYNQDTIRVKSNEDLRVELSSAVEMDVVEVEGSRNAFTMSAASKRNTEEINRGVLRKGACCNLSESFETSASVDVVFTDAVSGTRKIQMLGLEGIYVQKMFEGVPFNRGLNNIVGLDEIPGPWLNAVQLTKGTGTVQNSYESMTGEINIEFLQPTEEALYADLFGNNQSRYEGNIIYTKPLNSKWSTGIFLSGKMQNEKVDNNNDGFLDMPLREGFNLMNRWKYKGDYVRSQFIVRYHEEDRRSGQNDFDYQNDFGTNNSYGVGVNVRHGEAMGKLGFLSKKREDQSLGIRATASRTEVDSYFGDYIYTGVQENFRVNAIAMTRLSRYSDHNFAFGAHYLYDDYQESFNDSTFSRKESVPGAYFEYTYERPRLSLIVGARNDWHNLFGNQFSPRIHAKYNFRPLTSLRATIGRGYRSPNAFADQLGLLATSREVIVLESPREEISWNTGLSLLHKFELFGRDAVFNADYYYTQFENQLVADRDTDARRLYFYNLDGSSFAHSFQAEFQFVPIKALGVKFAYKYQDVQIEYLTGQLQKPLAPQNRFLLNLGYSWNEEKWIADFTINYFGTSRIPSTAANPEELQLSNRSEDFFLINAQLNRVLGNFEVYIGSENLGNFIQPDAIVDPENPFGNNFDATLIYGPINGRTIYAGVRFKLENKK